MAVQPIPEGYPRVTPYLIVDGAADAIDFYKEVLGATERGVMTGPDGRVGHAELAIGDSVVMLADEHPEMDITGPTTIGGSPVMLHVYVADVDLTMEQAVKAGATTSSPAQDQFYGDRSGQFVDPFGHRWNIATHIEDVPPDEMERRAAAAMADGGA
jgi:PhnB protein